MCVCVCVRIAISPSHAMHMYDHQQLIQLAASALTFGFFWSKNQLDI